MKYLTILIQVFINEIDILISLLSLNLFLLDKKLIAFYQLGYKFVNMLFFFKKEFNFISGVDKKINKRGQSFKNFTPERLPIGVPVNEAKLVDVRKLLETHFGQDWASLVELQYYKKVLNSENSIGRLAHEEEIAEDDAEEILNFV